ncbi:MAG: hypothetical protein P3A58_06950 [Gemmatimonadota bacterium]|jgi:hypothetical protein|nr:hypothetical protein [Gemmatimonadota bacterium]MDQ8147690.1 hypothetical protein [Gemmatimonadota bacterium]MDQ8177079.1 hypothetical protein [Gemmatimonadota bacterium]
MFVLEQEYGIGEDELDGFEIVDGEDLNEELSDEDDDLDEDDEGFEDDDEEGDEDDDLIDLDDEFDDPDERDEAGTPGRYDD